MVTLVFIGMVHWFLDVLFIAALLAAAARPLQRRIAELLGGRSGLAAGVSLLFFSLFGLLVLAQFSMILLEQAQSVYGDVSRWVDEVRNPERGTQVVQRLLDSLPLVHYLELSPRDVQRFVSEHAGEFISYVPGLVKNTAQLSMGWFTTLSGILGWYVLKTFVFLYATYFFLKEGDRIKSAIQQTIPLPGDLKQRLIEKWMSVVRATIKGTLVVGLLQGVLAGGAFAVAGLQGSVFWGVLVIFASMVPGIGTGLVWVPIVFYLLFVQKMVGTAIALGLWCAIVVGLVDNILRPRLVGNDTKMPDLLILLSTIGGVLMFNAIGLLIGPAIAAICVLMWDVFRQTFGETYESETQEPLAAQPEPSQVSSPQAVHPVD